MKPKQRPYYKFSDYLKERFGCRVYKVSIDAGFSCPNRDGSKSRDGCIYCDNKGFSFNSRIPPRPIENQIAEGIKVGRERFKAGKFIVYFQAYTNTYAPLKQLKEKYDIVKRFKDIVGISIGTRPDCVNEEILELIDSYTGEYEVWLEYGLQSIHRKTLESINRGHLYEDFLKAIESTRKRKEIKICAHTIVGLPGETRADILKTAEELGRLKLEGVKIHPLYIIKGTKLEEVFRHRLYAPLTRQDYISLVSEFLEFLWPDTVIQRITADSPRQFLIAPLWILEKSKTLKEIDEALVKKERFQGRIFKD